MTMATTQKRRAKRTTERPAVDLSTPAQPVAVDTRSIRELIEVAHKTHGLRIVDIAAGSGFGLQTIHRWKRGECAPRESNRRVFADYVNALPG